MAQLPGPGICSFFSLLLLSVEQTIFCTGLLNVV